MVKTHFATFSNLSQPYIFRYFQLIPPIKQKVIFTVEQTLYISPHLDKKIVIITLPATPKYHQKPQLGRTIAQLDRTIVQLDRTIAQLGRTIAQLDRTIAQLEHLIDKQVSPFAKSWTIVLKRYKSLVIYLVMQGNTMIETRMGCGYYVKGGVYY